MIGAAALCLFPLWPDWMRILVYWCSLLGASFVGFMLFLIVRKYGFVHFARPILEKCWVSVLHFLPFGDKNILAEMLNECIQMMIYICIHCINTPMQYTAIFMYVKMTIFNKKSDILLFLL